MGPILIGLAGPAGVGKDTAARFLADEFGLYHTSFAGPIKDALSAIGFERSEFDRDDKKDLLIPDFGVSYRHLVNKLGTDFGRGVVPDFWLRIAQLKFNTLNSYIYRGLVVSDVRFENEAHWVRHAGLLIHIDGPSRRAIAPDSAKHVSTQAVSRLPGDVIVSNTATPAHLYQQLSAAVERTLS